MSPRVYAWEQSKWAWHKSVEVQPQYRAEVTRRIAAMFGIEVNVQLTLIRNHSGRAWPLGSRIKLPSYEHRCNIGVIIHEVAHLVNSKLYSGHGHTGTWKRALIKVYVETRPYLKSILLAAKQAHVINEVSAARQAERQMAHAQVEAAKKAYRKTRAYKIQLLEKRIARLETRRKRTETMLKTARRSLSAYRRLEAIGKTSPKEVLR